MIRKAADTKLTYHDGDGDGDYEGFDLFGRIVDHRWEDVSAASNIDRYTHGYDRASNRLYKENTQTSSEDELYSYDDLNRLTNAQRGDLDSNKDSINSKAFEQDWGLDISGNWSGFEEDDNGDGTFDLDQSREHNLVNEIDDTSGDGHAITESAGSPWADPDHDNAGNMTTVPKPTDMSSTYEATYDAWNRLVKLEDSNGDVVEYEYDGLNRRIVEEVDTNDDGTLDETRHVYYTQRWQRIEMRKGGTASGDVRKHWVWGTSYIDELIQRKRDTGTDGTFDETHYTLQDANFRVTATIDTTGSVVERYKYTAYGERTVLNSDWSSDTDGDSDMDLRVGFQGRYHEDVTKLMYFRNRYYHNRLGRFISRDPMGYVTLLNFYHHTQNNPVLAVDPFGYWGKDIHVGMTLSAYWSKKDYKHCLISQIADENEDTDELTILRMIIPLPFVGPPNAAHFNRAMEGSRTAAKNRYDSILKQEKVGYENALSQGDCEHALDHLGAYLHFRQDFFSHAILTNSSNEDGFLPTPDDTRGADPSSYPAETVYGGVGPFIREEVFQLESRAEHPLMEEPVEPNTEEYRERLRAAERDTAEQSRLLDKFLENPECCVCEDVE